MIGCGDLSVDLLLCTPYTLRVLRTLYPALPVQFLGILPGANSSCNYPLCTGALQAGTAGKRLGRWPADGRVAPETQSADWNEPARNPWRALFN